jgi:hypothetical protein
VEFDLADLEVQVKDFVDDNSVTVKYTLFLTTIIVLLDRSEVISIDMDP